MHAAKLSKKWQYPEPDPRHVDACDCDCHLPGSAVVHFDACCHPCKCGHLIKPRFREEHAKTCVPVKRRHEK